MSAGQGKHNTDPHILRLIYWIYLEWLELTGGIDNIPTAVKTKLLAELAKYKATLHDDELSAYTELRAEAATLTSSGQGWPNIIYGPRTLGSDLYHTVLVITDATGVQERYIAERFGNLMDWSFDRLHPIMTLAQIDKLETLANFLHTKYDLVRTQ